MSTELVGREVELEAALAAVRASGGAVITGAAGVGKTALATAVADRVRAGGRPVVWTVATEASRRMPFAALGALVPDDTTSFHPALAVGLVRRGLAGLGGNGPPLVVVDDAHLLDDQSAVTLLALAGGDAVRALVTVRSGERCPDAVTALWKDGFLQPSSLDPLDRAGTRDLLQRHLEGDVAAATAELLWQVTRGNPLYLSELARYGVAEKRLCDIGGVWLWQGPLEVPPRLAELLERRFEGLSPDGLDALGALVLAQPLSLATLAAVATAGAVEEIEDRRLVAAHERDGTVWLRVAHPLLAKAAAGRLTPMRRRRIADALAAASRERVASPAEASWMLDASQPPPVADLVAAAHRVLLHNPALALRFAERAAAADDGPAGVLALADAHAELGRRDDAWEAHAVAARRADSDGDRLVVLLSEAALTTWTDRRPRAALAQLHAARPTLPAPLALEVDSAIALITLFAARPADALAAADGVLAADPPPSPAARLRAVIARVGALCLVGQRHRANEALGELLVLAADTSSPYLRGLAHAMTGVARLIDIDGPAPATHPASGRWPTAGTDGAPAPGATGGDGDGEGAGDLEWPLVTGARRLFEGRAGEAVGHLREALAHQRVGEGLFRSEAVALLIVGLAASGDVDEAEQLLAEEPPDEVAVYPGLRGWARGAVGAARGEADATDHLVGAAAVARSVGCWVSAVAYLHQAARFGDAPRAAKLVDELPGPTDPDDLPELPEVAARLHAIRARAGGDGHDLLAAAERHATARLCGDALELAGLAVAALGRDTSGARARAALLADGMREHLRIASPRFEPVVGLSRRELEVARLAARGMTDRDIAHTLVLSVRTVESHLASAYRKLGIGSRRQLTDVLAEMA